MEMDIKALMKKGDVPKLFDEEGNQVSLADVCKWWISAYPSDIFVKEPRDIIEARTCMERLLNKIEGGAHKKVSKGKTK